MKKLPSLITIAMLGARAVFVFSCILPAVLLFAFAAVEAQQAKVHRIGVLTPRSPSDSAPWHRAFREGLHDLGWVEGKNIAIEYRYAQGNRDRLPDLAAELLRLKVAVVVVVSVYAARAIQEINKAMPIVMASAADPVQLGLVASVVSHAVCTLSKTALARRYLAMMSSALAVHTKGLEFWLWC